MVGKVLNPLWQLFLPRANFRCCKRSNIEQSRHQGHTAWLLAVLCKALSTELKVDSH